MRESLNDFETSLPLRLDYEACLAYVLLPPVGGVLLLMLEWKSDYVRYVGLLFPYIVAYLWGLHEIGPTLLRIAGFARVVRVLDLCAHGEEDAACLCTR